MSNDKALRAELRKKSTTALHAMVQAPDTPTLVKDMAKEVLFERGRLLPGETKD